MRPGDDDGFNQQLENMIGEFSDLGKPRRDSNKMEMEGSNDRGVINSSSGSGSSSSSSNSASSASEHPFLAIGPEALRKRVQLLEQTVSVCRTELRRRYH